MSHTNNKNCIIYCRVSSAKSAQEGESLDAQEGICRKFVADRGFAIVPNGTVFRETFSGRKDKRPVLDDIFDYMENNPGKVDYFVFRVIDRFTRGGSYSYEGIKKRLSAHGVEMIDTYGVIQPMKNTLEHVGFEYEWSRSSPSEIAETVIANTAKAEITNILTRMIGREIELTNEGFKIREAADGYQNKKVFIGGKKKVIQIPHPERAKYFVQMFNLRAAGTHTDKEIVSRINAMGYRTNIHHRWDKAHEKVIGSTGGVLLTVKRLQEVVCRPIYCGVMCEKWTRYQPIKAQYEGLVSADVFRERLLKTLEIVEERQRSWKRQNRASAPSLPYARRRRPASPCPSSQATEEYDIISTRNYPCGHPTAIVGALSELAADELGLFQILWQPVHENWSESIRDAVIDGENKPFFVNMPELTDAAEKKVSKPLYAAVVRVAAKAGTFERAVDIARDLAGSLRVFAQPGGNELIPLRNDEYPFAEHIEDVIRRQSRRTGMILNSDELIGFVHLPSSAVRSPVLERQTGKEAPAIVRQPVGLLLGNNVHLGESIPVRLTPEQRVYHTHIIGATGTGKSTLLFNLIRQDIENNQGVAVLDPHGDLVEKILGVIPPERIKDVVLVDPSDEEFSIGFNILSAQNDHERTLLASDLVSVFQRLSTSWGDQMQSVFQNAILAFLNSSKGGTLADLRRFLVEPAFRQEFLKSVSDPNVLYYWHKGFAHLSGNKSIGPILTRLEMFLAQRPIAHMVSQPENRLDFGDIMDGGKIFLAKLPEGLLGKENSYLLGAVLVSKFQQLVMARQGKKIAARRDFWIYIDEFANFITPSMAEILSGARKYRIGLTLAHHELHQLQRSPDVASAVITHPYTRIVFRVGDDDAKKLADGFSSFDAADLKNLETGQAICRVERSNFDFNLSVPVPDMPGSDEMEQRQNEVIAASRAAYGTPRAEVEAMLRHAWEVETAKPAPVKPKPPLDEPPASPPSVQPVAPVLPPKTSDVPKVADVSEDTVSEKKVVEPPRNLGRGGAQHQAIQQRIKKAAEELGFRSIIEKPVRDGHGSVDLLLERDGQSIACEISFSTTIDHEVGNVAKCLKGGYSKVAVICLDEERLRKINTAVSGSLGPEMAACVECFQPDQFIAYLKQLKPPTPQPSETESGGYKIRRSVPKLSAQERRQKEDVANRVIAETMRRAYAE